MWSDAGIHDDYIPIPDTPRFRTISHTTDFCPVFFEKDLQQAEVSRAVKVNGNVIPRTKQPLAILPSRYGETLKWDQVSHDPLMLLQELFHFQSSAAAQYLNMLRDLTTEIMSRTPHTGEKLPSMDDILHFEYTKTVLGRWCAHFKTLADSLDDGVLHVSVGLQQQSESHAKVVQTLKKDLEFLFREAETLMCLCDSGKSTIMSSFAVYESRQAAAESSEVKQLTKATNRITFVFLPISFVTSVFGMNFRQFGQGPLSITIWLTVTLPLLIVCVLLNECGAWLSSKTRTHVRNKRAGRHD